MFEPPVALVLSLLILPPFIEWVQDKAAATTTWGDIGDWDVSGVVDFSFAFSKHRDAAGGSEVSNSNLKAASFVGTAMSKWTTTSVTSLKGIFYNAGEMNSDLSGWNVAKVTTLASTFYGVFKFTGAGLGSWDTASVTTLSGTFSVAREMNADLSGWNVAKVTTLWRTFYGVFKFTGAGLGSWDTASVTTLSQTFESAGEMNSDLSKWSVAMVTTLQNTFNGASKFTGTGLPTWNIAKVTDMSDTFTSTTAITSCSKRQIADAWKSNSAFATWNTAWAADACPPLTDATFKQASWGT